MAGIVFQTSFDHYSTIIHRWNSVIGIGAPSTTTAGAGRHSTDGLRITNATSALVAKTLPAPLTDIWLAFAFRTSALPTGGSYRIIVELRDAGTRQLHLVLRTDGTLAIYRGGTTDTPSGTLLDVIPSFSLLPNVWYHFEWYARIDNSSGLLQFRVNEVEKLNVSSRDTQESASASVSEICLAAIGNGATVDTDFDDVVVRDDDWNGDQQVRCFLPTGIGSTNQWTASGAATTREAVDETAPNEDTDYISEDTAGQTSLFTYDSIPSDAVITAVIPLPRAKKTDSGTAKIKSALRSGGTTYTDGVESAPSDGGYEYHPDIRMVNPDTGVAFTAADWNEPIEIGPNRSA